MKKLMILLVLLFSVSLTANAQTVGSTRSDVLKKNGAPTSIIGTDVYMYVMDKGVVLAFQFEGDRVEMMSVHRKRTPDQHKAIYNRVVSQRGEPTGEVIKGKTLYSVWKYKNYNYLVTYDSEKGVSGILVTKSINVTLGI